jgi:hypothetical protein
LRPKILPAAWGLGDAPPANQLKTLQRRRMISIIVDDIFNTPYPSVPKLQHAQTPVCRNSSVPEELRFRCRDHRLSESVARVGVAVQLPRHAGRFVQAHSGGPQFQRSLCGKLQRGLPGGTAAFVVLLHLGWVFVRYCRYPPFFAGAVAAVASTGGQIAAPVMGTAALVMAKLAGTGFTTGLAGSFSV